MRNLMTLSWWLRCIPFDGWYCLSITAMFRFNARRSAKNIFWRKCSTGNRRTVHFYLDPALQAKGYIPWMGMKTKEIIEKILIIFILNFLFELFYESDIWRYLERYIYDLLWRFYHLPGYFKRSYRTLLRIFHHNYFFLYQHPNRS